MPARLASVSCRCLQQPPASCSTALRSSSRQTRLRSTLGANSVGGPSWRRKIELGIRGMPQWKGLDVEGVRQANGSSRSGQWDGRRKFHFTSASLARDPYKALGVEKDASQADIKKAYYTLAKKFHPDVNKEVDAKERYQEVQDAYDTLSDGKKRAAYDRFGAASQQPGFDPNAFAGGFPGGGHPFADMFGGGGRATGSPQDIFDSLFGAFGGRAGGARSGASQQVFVGEDIEASLNISFLEMAKGTNKTVNIAPVVDCPACDGNGTKVGAKPKSCDRCGGQGTVTFVVQGGFTMASTCQACGGSGERIDEKDLCGGCNGVGKVRTRQTVDVKIPAGVEDGMKIKLAGKGDAPVGGGRGMRGRPGDLYVRIGVLPSRQFRRQGNNLYADMIIPFHKALIGGTVRVPTLEAQVDVKVPSGTQPGEELVLKGRGVKHLYKEWFGDLIVKFNLTIPRSLGAAQRAAIDAYVAATEGKPTASSISAGLDTKASRKASDSSSEKAGTEVTEDESGDGLEDKRPQKPTASA